MDEAKNQINDWNIRKKKTTSQNNKKKKKNPKTKDGVNSLWDNFKHSNIHIIGVTERKEKEQEIGNLFEKIMKENFPNLVKERHASPGSIESPKQDGCKEAHSKTHYN